MLKFIAKTFYTIQKTLNFLQSNGRNQGYLKDKVADKKALCSECTPQEFNDGSIDYRKGKWHNRFKKQTSTVKLIKEMGERILFM